MKGFYIVLLLLLLLQVLATSTITIATTIIVRCHTASGLWCVIG